MSHSAWSGALIFGKLRKEIHRLLHGHLQHLGDVLAAVLDIQRFAVEPAAAAVFAAHEGRRQEIHLQFDGAGAFTFRAASLGAVERETARPVAAQPRFGDLGNSWRMSSKNPT